MKPRMIAGGIAWLLLALVAISLADDPGMAVPVWLFWAGSGFLAVRGVLALLKRERAAPRGKSGTVSVCLAKPMVSPSVDNAMQAMPKYCRSVLFNHEHEG